MWTLCHFQLILHLPARRIDDKAAGMRPLTAPCCQSHSEAVNAYIAWMPSSIMDSRRTFSLFRSKLPIPVNHVVESCR